MMLKQKIIAFFTALMTLLGLWFAPADKVEGIFPETEEKTKVEFDEGVFETVKLKYPVMANALRDDVDLLNWRHKGFLQSLPPQLNLQFEGIKFLLVHGSPRKNNEDILPDTPLETVEEMIERINREQLEEKHLMYFIEDELNK